MKRDATDFGAPAGAGESDQLAEEAATWFIRLRQPRLADHERQRFQRWLASSERHQREYASFEKLWGAIDGLARPRRRKQRLAGGAFALAVAAVLALVYTATGVDLQKSTGIGETAELQLADGSHIAIDADSVLHVEYSLWRRRITLERGQALFKVAPGLRPFEVRAGEGSLRDIGTTFNVLEDRGKVTVSVTEGAVEISLDAQPTKRLLNGGQQASYQAGRISASQAITPQAACAWLDNRWLFAEASLGEVVRQINRQHERPVSLADSALDRYRVSGVFDRTDRAGLLKALAAILPVRVQETPDGTRLRQR
ncbi:FecR family protein [Azonexus sp. IMCC34842]|uniref:FecR family protein n=1 Tax=Azonexus sp. IMCC34842 TaxID=3420950 RepID=UPI003D0FEF1F